MPNEIPIFEENPQELRLKKQQTQQFGKLVKVEYVEGEGLLSYYENMTFPMRGLMYDDVVEAITIPKRCIISFARILGSLFTHPFRSLITQYVHIAGWSVYEYRLNLDCYSPSVKELYSKALPFFIGTGKEFIRILSLILEYDSAYRYRTQDLFSVLRKTEFQKRPIRELRRALRTCSNREVIEIPGATDAMKWKMISNIISLALIIPKNRRIARNYVASLDFSKIQLDKIDWEFCNRAQGYNFGGLTIEERVQRIQK